VRLTPGSGVRRPRVLGGFSVTSPRRARAIGLVVDDHHEALGAAEPVVRGIEEPLEDYWVHVDGENPST
jgi:hypothetical protein